jgi:low affinity Fe/Cu permease
MAELFSRFAKLSADMVGKWQTFIVALVLILAWVLAGFHYGFADQIYQLFINTITTIITFLMVFLLQNTQTRDTLAIQLKLDELIAATRDASYRFIRIEDLTEQQLRKIRDLRR